MRILTFSALLLLLLCGVSSISAQNLEIKKINVAQGCNYGNGITRGEITVVGGSKDAQKIVQEILGALPMITKPEFTLNAGPVPNAVALMQGEQRYIIYSEKFMESFQNKSLTRWASYSLLAHEVGHHVNRHTFGEKTREQSHKDELEADEFSARVLAHLGATLDEALAGIKAFDKDGESDSHPAPDIREEVITIAYKEEVGKLANIGINKFVLDLDESCFANPWNLATEANTQAELDQEKVTIKIQIPSGYSGKRLKVCLKSNDPNMTPEARTTGSVGGTGVDMPYTPVVSIVWNYKMDRYGQDQVSRPKILRVYVYATDDQPREPAGAKFLWGTVGVAGLGAAGYSFVLRSDAQKQYDANYVPDAKRTGDANYEKAQETYDAANRKYIRSQYILGAGLALATVGTILFVRAQRQSKEAKRSICLEEPQWQIEPLIVCDSGFGAGFRVRF